MEPLTAREHALRASWLLADHDPTPQQLDLARSHGIAALALCMTEDELDPDEAHR